MQVTVLEFVEHRLHGLVIVSQRLAHAVRQPLVVDQFPQALPREAQVIVTTVPGIVSRRFRPGPFWQCGERPLPNAH